MLAVSNPRRRSLMGLNATLGCLATDDDVEFFKLADSSAATRKIRSASSIDAACRARSEGCQNREGIAAVVICARPRQS